MKKFNVAINGLFVLVFAYFRNCTHKMTASAGKRDKGKEEESMRLYCQHSISRMANQIVFVAVAVAAAVAVLATKYRFNNWIYQSTIVY